jgi:hypothetical protein
MLPYHFLCAWLKYILAGQYIWGATASHHCTRALTYCGLVRWLPAGWPPLPFLGSCYRIGFDTVRDFIYSRLLFVILKFGFGIEGFIVLSVLDFPSSYLSEYLQKSSFIEDFLPILEAMVFENTIQFAFFEDCLDLWSCDGNACF